MGFAHLLGDAAYRQARAITIGVVLKGVYRLPWLLIRVYLSHDRRCPSFQHLKTCLKIEAA
jgi:hypothetical protein